jgi:1-acyl-sn-glycerol-3-phosphate acyltransferase
LSPVQTSRLGRVLYWTGYAFFRTVFTVIWRLRIVGRNNIPAAGPALFASNHVSFADPPLVGCCLSRMIHFMAKQELFEVPLLGWFIGQVNAFPIRRVERDVAAFKTAQRILQGGGAIILFPEGTRQKSGLLGTAKPGVGMLAALSGSPVVPVYVHNSNRLKSLKRVAVCFGAPMSVGRGADYYEFSKQVMQAIAGLKETYVGSRNQE